MQRKSTRVLLTVLLIIVVAVVAYIVAQLCLKAAENPASGEKEPPKEAITNNIDSDIVNEDNTNDDDSVNDTVVDLATASDTYGPPRPDLNLTIDCIGDVIMHTPQYTNMYDSSGNIDLSLYFDYIKEDVESADLAILNAETTFGGGEYRSFPMFNSPDELADWMFAAGFDIATTSNNHMIDSGAKGVSRTIKVLQEAGFQVAGSQLSESDPDWIITKVKGLKVGIVAFTYETPLVGGRHTINGNYVPSEVADLINSYRPGVDEEEARVGDVIDDARTEGGADIVVCYFHWGNEYEREPNDSQRRMAQLAADAGADIIFASHPHVVQPMESIMDVDGRAVPVFWSLGNYISNQRTETLNNNRYLEQGLKGRVELNYSGLSERIVSFSMSYMPLWVDKYTKGNRILYAVVPLIEGYESNTTLLDSGHFNRAKQALSDIRALVGEPLTVTVKSN